ncbi:hypothetical protein ACFL3B_03215 [Gemmatimonadota bacterium]
MKGAANIPVLVGGVLFVLLALLTSDASVLPALLLVTAVVQGLFALAAAAHLAEGRWILPARGTIFSLHPLMLWFPVAFLAFSTNLSIYGWTEHHTVWLSPAFFVARNVIMLLVTWALAFGFAKAASCGSERASLLAVLYAFAFVLNQSLLAFDWVMSFDYPWISTLFGGYFFIEAMFGALAVLSLLGMRLMAQGKAERGKTFLDTSTFMFGWSLLWAGQLFAQFLVIWYGNIPEEQLFLVRRLVDAPLREMAICVPIFLFVIPFTVLLSRKAKSSNLVMTILAALVFTGIFIERLLFLIPVAHMNPFVVVLALVALAGPLAWMVKQGADEESGAVEAV